MAGLELVLMCLLLPTPAQEQGTPDLLVERWADARFWIVSQDRRVGWQRYQVQWEDYEGAKSLRVDFERASSRFWGQRFTALLKADESLSPLEIRWVPGWACVRVAKGSIDPGLPFAKPAPAHLTLFPEILAALLPLKEGAELPFSHLSPEGRVGLEAGPLRVFAQEAVPGAPAGSTAAWKIACPTRQQYSTAVENWDTTLWIRPDRTLAGSTSTITYDTWDGKKRVVKEGLVPMKAEEWNDSSPATNEIIVAAQLCLLADMSRQLRANDLDGNNQNDCWTGDVSGLYRLMLPKEKDPIRLISREAALADAAPLPAGPEKGGGRLAEALGQKPVPFHGYFFKMLPKGWSEGAPVLLNDGSNHHPYMFAICAYPTEYGKSGRRTFIISESMDPYSKDLKGQPVDAFPADLAKDRWEWTGSRR